MTKTQALQKLDDIWLLLAKVQEAQLEAKAQLINHANEQQVVESFSQIRAPHRQAVHQLLLLRNEIEKM